MLLTADLAWTPVSAYTNQTYTAKYKNVAASSITLY